MATLDMVLEIIASISPNASQDIANRLLVSYPRAGLASQPGSLAHRLRGVPGLLSKAVRMMADNITHPIQASEIAMRCGISSRNLERMFRKHLGVSPMRYYTVLRLEHAHDLVMQTDMPLLDVAVACGFGSTGALTKKFKRTFATTPSRMREKSLISENVTAPV